MQLQTALKTELLSQIVERITGEKPLIEKTETYSHFRFSPGQQIKLRAFLKAQLKPQPPGDIRIDAAPVVLPVLVEQAAPYILGVAALGFLIGRLSKK